MGFCKPKDVNLNVAEVEEGVKIEITSKNISKVGCIKNIFKYLKQLHSDCDCK